MNEHVAFVLLCAWFIGGALFLAVGSLFERARAALLYHDPLGSAPPAVTANDDERETFGYGT